jgi:uncharacterized protein
MTRTVARPDSRTPPGRALPRDPAIREATARLVAALAPERILLFGSHAWGAPDADSDLDLYLIVPDGSEPAHRVARRGHLALRGIGVPIDLVVRTCSESARNAQSVSTLDYEVLARGVALYG